MPKPTDRKKFMLEGKDVIVELECKNIVSNKFESFN